MTAIANKPYTAYNQYSYNEWNIIKILIEHPGLLAESLYDYFPKRSAAKQALHHLASKKIVYNENFRWYLTKGVKLV